MNTRRPTSSVALIPKVEGRGSRVGEDQPFARLRRTILLPSPLRPLSGRKNAGMTMIELGLVMGIVSVLLALVLGLGRHVNATVKIRRAQADLGVWHETLNRWHLQFGEYPHTRINPDLDSVDPLDSVDWELKTPSRFPLTILTNQCEIIFPTTNITFRSYLTSAVNTVDPWGMPYIYVCDPGGKAYTLFSCGPDRKSADLPSGTSPPSDPTLDDIYFER